jgi:hypothetical protein
VGAVMADQPTPNPVVVEAIHDFALMYPISSWGLAHGEAAENLAGRWADIAGRMVTEYLEANGLKIVAKKSAEVPRQDKEKTR